MIVKPQGFQILIEKIEPPKKEDSGIFLFDETKAELDSKDMPFLTGRVLSTGQLAKYAKVGDIILYEKHVPNDFTYEGKKYSIFKEEYITAWLVPEQKAEA